jgi:formylglycine-generating enzyme
MFFNQKQIFIFILISIVKEISSDCGCSQANREERAKKYERSVVSPEEDREPESVFKHASDYDKMSLIPAGKYSIGTNEPVFEADKEGPERELQIEKFYLDKYEVSNGDFQDFVSETGYVTEAEKFGDSFVFKAFLSPEVQKEYEGEIDQRVVIILNCHNLVSDRF